LFALFWFAGSIAWAKAISDIQAFTNTDNIINSMPKVCPVNSNNCSVKSYPTYANLIVSCVNI
jgi:hypothetical protein